MPLALNVSAFAGNMTELQAENEPGVSTFRGEPTRGGWIPVLLDKPGLRKPIIIDWVCPVCSQIIFADITGRNQCPRCGLQVLEKPVIKAIDEENLAPTEREAVIKRKLQLWQKFAVKENMIIMRENKRQAPASNNDKMAKRRHFSKAGRSQPSRLASSKRR